MGARGATGAVCSRCGAAGDGSDLPPGWSLSNEEPGVVLRLCAECTRAHVRDIEAKLDETWWGP
jgi:hypothetical protein